MSLGIAQIEFLCPHLGFYLPPGDGGLPVIPRPELHCDRTRADAADGDVGWRSGQFYGKGEHVNVLIDTDRPNFCSQAELSSHDEVLQPKGNLP